MTKLWNKRGGTPPLIFSPQIRKKKSSTAMNLHKPSPNNHKPGEVGAGTVHRSTAKRNTAKCLSENVLQSRNWMHLCLFSRKEPVLGFSYLKFSKLYKDLRVSGGSRTMVYRIQPSSVVPLTFPGHSLVSIHGEGPLTP